MEENVSKYVININNKTNGNNNVSKFQDWGTEYDRTDLKSLMADLYAKWNNYEQCFTENDPENILNQFILFHMHIFFSKLLCKSLLSFLFKTRVSNNSGFPPN